MCQLCSQHVCVCNAVIGAIACAGAITCLGAGAVKGAGVGVDAGAGSSVAIDQFLTFGWLQCSSPSCQVTQAITLCLFVIADPVRSCKG